MNVQQRCECRWVIVLMSLMLGPAQTLWAEPIGNGWAIPVQVPYEAPPKGQNLPAESVPQNTKPLTAVEVQRAEALLPLLEGTQEFWAIGGVCAPRRASRAGAGQRLDHAGTAHSV